MSISLQIAKDLQNSSGVKGYILSTDVYKALMDEMGEKMHHLPHPSPATVSGEMRIGSLWGVEIRVSKLLPPGTAMPVRDEATFSGVTNMNDAIKALGESMAQVGVGAQAAAVAMAGFSNALDPKPPKMGSLATEFIKMRAADMPEPYRSIRHIVRDTGDAFDKDGNFLLTLTPGGVEQIVHEVPAAEIVDREPILAR